MSYHIAKWYLYFTVRKRTGRWPDKILRRWVRQSLRTQIHTEKMARNRHQPCP